MMNMTELTEAQRQEWRVELGINLRIIAVLRSYPAVQQRVPCVRANQLKAFSADAAFIVRKLGGMAAAW